MKKSDAGENSILDLLFSPRNKTDVEGGEDYACSYFNRW